MWNRTKQHEVPERGRCLPFGIYQHHVHAGPTRRGSPSLRQTQGVDIHKAHHIQRGTNLYGVLICFYMHCIATIDQLQYIHEYYIRTRRVVRGFIEHRPPNVAPQQRGARGARIPSVKPVPQPRVKIATNTLPPPNIFPEILFFFFFSPSLGQLCRSFASIHTWCVPMYIARFGVSTLERRETSTVPK